MKNKITQYRGQLGFMMSVLLAASVSGQVTNKGTLYIADKGKLYISNGTVNFGGNAISKTTRTSNTYGVMSFSSLANVSNASDVHFLDGFARTYNITPFIAPIGASSTYAPAQVTPSTDSGVDLAYFRSNPLNIFPDLSNDIYSVSNIEYWIIKGAESKISLSWRTNSNVGTLPFILSADYVTIVGYKDGQWIEIPSTVDVVSFLNDTSNLVGNGSITSNANVNLSDFTAFTIGAKKELPCFPAVTSSGNTKTWSGSAWSPSPPSIVDPVVLEGNYDGASAGSFACFSVSMGNFNINLVDSNTLEVGKGFIIDESDTGKIIMSSKAIVLQRDGTTTSGPIIEMTKITNPMRRYDYVFLSSPINNMTTFFEDILDNNKTAVNGSFGAKPHSAFEQLRTFNAAGLTAINASVANTPVGRGFSATVRNQSPYSSSMAAQAWYNQKETIHLKTEGKANNGNVEVVVPANGWVRIGNPYPSPIDGSRLLDAMGSKVRQTLYYWTYSTPRGTIAADSYNNASFATWNRSGGTAATESEYVPNGHIGTMQSVLTKAITDQGSTTFNITNCMRTLTGNDDYLKTYNSNDIGNSNGKFRLNLVGSTDSFSQILIAYDAENGTLDYDNGYDSQRLSGLSSEISTIINNSRYVIQTRPGFNAADAVPLYFDKRTDENFTINLASTEGVFETTPIFLHDKTLGIYHNLISSGYSFIQTDSADTSRFEVVYENSMLSAGEFDNKSAFAFITKNQFRAQSNTTISEITIYDMSGRLITTYTAINQQGFSSSFNKAQGVYIAKIKLVDGTIVNQKVINQ